eukprot:scaffold89202_cov69-Phaeocystis_antarctica.AAC.13
MHYVPEAPRLLCHGDGFGLIECRRRGGVEFPPLRHFCVVAKVHVEQLRVSRTGGPDRCTPKCAPIRRRDPLTIARLVRRLATAIAVVAQPAAKHCLGQPFCPWPDRLPLSLHRTVPLAQIGGALPWLGNPRDKRERPVLVATDRRQRRQHVTGLRAHCGWTVIWAECDLKVGQS